ncbi:hypothetical protein DXN04_34310 [Chitinophaga silvisoli]|uniref:Transposase IS4-like domain-containing protein n=1 Tax=Chitinophaga silvisoli TaxID=2291814 RepID=A0A3E1NKB4_9BACT|nr:hypothetical protein DXN04_34310 [Chitinophaga silvisoli]
MDAFSGVTEFVRITPAKEYDRKFLYHLKLKEGSWIVFDKAYNTYRHFAKWTTQKVWFVSRMKDNAVFHVTKVLVDKTKQKQAIGVIKEQHITVGIKTNRTETERLKLRRVVYKTRDGKRYIYITNDFTLPEQGVLSLNIKLNIQIHPVYFAKSQKPKSNANNGEPNWSSKSSKTFGHTFIEHGQKRSVESMADRSRSRQDKMPIGRWLNDEKAAAFIKRIFNTLKPGENIVNIPDGLGEVIYQDKTREVVNRA